MRVRNVVFDVLLSSATTRRRRRTAPRRSLVALSMLVVGIFAGTSGLASATAAPVGGSPVLTNGSFETGDFTGWTVNSADGCQPWRVLPSGTQPCYVSFQPGGYSVLPVDGNDFADITWDGSGTVDPEITQVVSLPASGDPTLTWSDNADWDLMSFGATQNRVASVDILDGSTVLASTPFLTIAAGTNANTGWVNRSLDLSQYAGQTVGIRFHLTVPQAFTGPADYSLDNVAIAGGVAAIDQTVAFTSTAPTSPALGDTYEPAATGGASGNPVTFSIDGSTTNSACSIDAAGSTVTFDHAGTCVVDGDQAGNATYSAAPTAQQTVTVGKSSQTVAFTSTAPDSPTLGDTYEPTATGGASGSPVTFSIDGLTTNNACSIDAAGTTVTFTHVGSCVVDADQAGSADYDAATTTSQSTTVVKSDQTVGFTSTAPTSPAIGDTYEPAATGGASGSPVTFSIDGSTTNSACSIDSAGSTVTFDHAGTCVVDGDQAGNADYNAAATTTQEASVGKNAQAVNFTSTLPTSPTLGDTYTPTATGGASGSPVTFTIDGATTNLACSIDAAGTTVTFDHAGSCVIDADQSGDADHETAPTATQSTSVTKAEQTVAFTSNAQPNPTLGDDYVPGATGGNSGNPVSFSIDGATTNNACSIDAAGSTVSFDHAGSCVIDAGQAGNADYSTAPIVSQTVGVDKAATTTAVAVRPASLTATVTTGPDAGSPTGDVVFSVGGATVGTATVHDGVATLYHVVPADKSDTVAAAFAGDGDHLASSASTTRHNPTIVATVSSTHPRTKYGWYRTPVEVRFHCTVGSAALTKPCPTPVRLSHNKSGRTVTRTIHATDGGVATSVTSVNIDRTAPSVHASGVRNGAVYVGHAPALKCMPTDSLSGVASCVRHSSTRAGVTMYRLTATDKAGNVTTVTGTYFHAGMTVLGVPFSHGAFTTHLRHRYTVRVISRNRPRYYYATPTHGGQSTPFSRGPLLAAAGDHIWTLRIHITKDFSGHQFWNIGSRSNGQLTVVKLRVL
jgi:hypothetical protein